MNNDGTVLKDLKKGMLVEINPQSDRTRKLVVEGKISEILTNAPKHPHGILVLLESGEKGRVKAIVENQSVSDVTEFTSTPSESLTISLNKIIEQGENHHVEFKSGALWSSRLTNEDIKSYKPQSKELHTYGQSTSKIIVAKTIAGFLNSDGGTLVIGIKENKDNNKDEVLGIETEFKFLKDPCQDGYRRMITDVIKDYFPTNIFNHLNQYIQIKFEKINDKLVCRVTAHKSDQKVFLKLKGHDHFFIRTDASTRELQQAEEIVDYCEKRF